MGRLWKALGALALVLPVLYHYATLAPREESRGRTVVRYMAWGYPSQLNTERDLVRTFESLPENKDIKVDFIMAPMSSYYDKLQMMFASKTGPDVVRINADHFYAYQDRGYLRPLTSLMAADPGYSDDDFWPAALRDKSVDGVRYAVGVLFTTTLVYYNKTIFERMGVKDPWERYNEGHWTWADFLDAARATTIYDEAGRPVQYGTSQMGGIYNVMDVVGGQGGRIISDDRRTSLVNSPKVVDCIQWLYDLSHRYRVAPTPQQSAMSVFSFESGKLAMFIGSSGASPVLRDSITQFDWDIAPAPEGPSGVSAGYVAHLLVMNADTRVPDAAWRFMTFMISPTAETLLGCKLRRCIPTRKAIALSDEYLQAHETPYNTQSFIARIDAPQPPTAYSDKWAEWSAVWAANLDRIFYADVPPQQAMDDAAVKINAILQGRDY